MDASKIAIQIASEFTGSKAFKKAETATEKLQRTVKNLARTLGVAFSAAAVVNFGKASVRAFADAEREGAVLANTMKNLGLAFDTSRVTAYIDNLGKLYGITGDEGVPAMQALLSATGSVTKSQELMNTAMNVAAANNISLSEAAKGLSQAYLGNRKALNQYNTGLTKAELQLKSFEDLQKLLDTRLAGAATEAAATYSGQLLILKENAEQAKEVIGKGLVDSFILLAGANGLPSATTAMQDFAKATAEATLGAASLIEKLKTGFSPNGFDLTGLIPVIGGYIGPGGVLDKLRAEGRKLGAQKMGAPGAISGKFPGGDAYFAAQRKAEEASIKRARELQAIERKRLDTAKKLAAEKAKKAALDKLSAFLNKAQQMFDMDRIQLAAAALSKQTEEDKVRIRLKQEILELEEAINDGNINAAVKLAGAISQDAKLLGQLRGDMISLGDVPNPFLEWLSTLEQMLATLKLIGITTPKTYTLDEQRTIIRGMLDKVAPSVDALNKALGINPSSPQVLGFPKLSANQNQLPPGFSIDDLSGFNDRNSSYNSGQPTYVTVNVAGSISTERDIVTAITQGIYNNQAAGTPINYSTVY
jgi:hypothetical protein